MGDSSPGLPAGKRGTPRQGVIVETARGVERHLNVHGTAFRIPERYNHLEVIGKGSYGMVCSAQDSYRRTAVAIKKITPMSEHSIDAKRALREVRVMRYLGAHENIVTLEDLFSNEENDELYIVMELLESDLHRIIQSPQTLSTQHHRVFMLQIFRGVKFLHENGIIHRDLKPGNILVTRNCEVRISDFGLARAKPRPSDDDEDLGEVEAMTEHVITRWYRPPELMLSPNGFYGFSVDIWSIGCIFGELIGRRPFFPGTSFVDQLCLIFDVIGAPAPEEIEHIQGAQARRFLREKEGKTPVAFEEVFPGIDTEAASLLKDLLVFDPDKRCTAGRALLHPFFTTIRAQAVPRDDAPEGLDFNFEHKRFSRSALKKLIAAEVDYFQSGANLRVHSTRTYTGRAAAAAASTTKVIRHPTTAGSPPEGAIADHREGSGAVESSGSGNSPNPIKNGGCDHHAGDYSPVSEPGTRMRGRLEQVEGEREHDTSVRGNPPGGKVDDCHEDRGATEKPGSTKVSYAIGGGEAGHVGDSPGEERVRSDCNADSQGVQAVTVSSTGESEQGTRSRDTPSNGGKVENGDTDRPVDTTVEGAGAPRLGQSINKASAERQPSKGKSHSNMAPIELELGRRDEDSAIAATPKETTAWHPFFVPSWRLRSTPVRQSSVAGFAAGVDVWDNDHAGWVVDRWGRWSRTGLRTPAKLARAVSPKQGGDETSEILKRKGIAGKNGKVMSRFASRTDRQLPTFNRSNSSSEMLRRERAKRAWEVLREAKGGGGQAPDRSVERRQSAGDCSGPCVSGSGAGKINSSTWSGIEDKVIISSATGPCYPPFASKTSRRQLPSMISASMSSTDRCRTAFGDKLFQQSTESGTVEGSTATLNNDRAGSSDSYQPDPEVCERQLPSCVGHEAQAHAPYAGSVVRVSRDAVFDSPRRHLPLNSPRNRAPKSTISAEKSSMRNQRSTSSVSTTNETRAPIASVHHPGNLRQSVSLDGDIEEGGPLSLTSSYGSPPAVPPPLGVHLTSDRRRSIGNSSVTQTLAGAGLFSAKDSKPGGEVHRKVRTKQDGRRRPRTPDGEVIQLTASPLSEGHPLRRTRPGPPTPLKDDDGLHSSSLTSGGYGGSIAAGRRVSPLIAHPARPTMIRVNSSLPAPRSGGITVQGVVEPTLSVRGEPFESPATQDRPDATAPGSSVPPLLSSPAPRQRSPMADGLAKLEHTVTRLSRSSSDVSVVADRGKAGTVRFEEPPSVVERRAKKGYHARPVRRAPTGRLRSVAGKAVSAPAPVTKAFNSLDPKIDWTDTGSRSGLTTRPNHDARNGLSFSAAPREIDSGVPGGPERNQVWPRMTVTPGEASVRLTRSQQQRRAGSLTRDNAQLSRSWRAKDSRIVGHRGNIDDATTATAESKFRILQRLWEHSSDEKDVGEVDGGSPLGLNSRVPICKAAAEQWAARGNPASPILPTPRTPVPRMGNTEAFNQETQGSPVYRSGGRRSITAVGSDDSTTITTSRDVEAMTQRVSDSSISLPYHKGAGATNNVNVSAFSSASVPSTLVADAAIDPRVQSTQARQRGQETLRVTRLSRLLPFRRFEFTGEDRSTEACRNEAGQNEHRGGSRQAISGLESFEEEAHGAPIAGELSGIAAGSSHESGWRYRQQTKEGAGRNERLSSLPLHPGRDKPEQRAGIQAGILRKMRSFPKRRRAKINPSL